MIGRKWKADAVLYTDEDRVKISKHEKCILKKFKLAAKQHKFNVA